MPEADWKNQQRDQQNLGEFIGLGTVEPLDKRRRLLKSKTQIMLLTILGTLIVLLVGIIIIFLIQTGLLTIIVKIIGFSLMLASGAILVGVLVACMYGFPMLIRLILSKLNQLEKSER